RLSHRSSVLPFLVSARHGGLKCCQAHQAQVKSIVPQVDRSRVFFFIQPSAYSARRKELRSENQWNKSLHLLLFFALGSRSAAQDSCFARMKFPAKQSAPNTTL